MTATDQYVIDTRGLTKAYAGVAVLKGLNLKVSKHSIFGFLGPNGAGRAPPSSSCLASRVPRLERRLCSARTGHVSREHGHSPAHRLPRPGPALLRGPHRSPDHALRGRLFLRRTTRRSRAAHRRNPPAGWPG